MKKNPLRLLASVGIIWVGLQFATQAYPIRATRGSNSHRIHNSRDNNYYPRRGESFFFEQRVIIERRGGYDNCYGCYRSPYHSPRSYNQGPVYYPNSPFSIYNRRNFRY